MPDEHAEFAPSASERWLVCPASVPLSAGKHNGDTIHTVRGTAMHNLAEQFLREWTHIDYIENDHGDIATLLDGETILIKRDEWRPHVVPYVKAVRADYQRWVDEGHEVKLLIEERVTISGKKCWGSCDAAVVVPGWYIGNYDLKTGAGKVVSANNPQNLCYLAGLAEKYDWDFLEYKCHIVQDANSDDDNVDAYTTGEKELKAHIKAVAKAIKSAPKAKPGPIGDHCRWCPSKTECPAQREAVVAIFNDNEEPKEKKAPMKAEKRDPASIPLVQLQWILEHADAMRDFIDACEAHAAKSIQMGVEIDGFKVVAANTKRRWTSEKTMEQIAAELELYGVEEPLIEQPPKLMTIGQVEKEIGKGQIDMLTEKPEGKPVLARESDKRHAIPVFTKEDE